MEEKTLEQLEKELDMLKKQNLAMELEHEQEKQKKRQDELAAKEKEKLKQELRDEIKKEYNLTAQSRLPTQSNDGKQSMDMTANKSFEEFKANFVERSQKRGRDIKGRTYHEMLEEMVYNRAGV